MELIQEPQQSVASFEFGSGPIKGRIECSIWSLDQYNGTEPFFLDNGVKEQCAARFLSRWWSNTNFAGMILFGHY